MTPDEQRAVRRHLHSAEGAHRLCRRKACRRARACRLAATSEEVRMIALALKAEGFAPCTTLALADGRWSCRTTNAAGQAMDLSLSNLDFAVTRRTRVP